MQARANVMEDQGACHSVLPRHVHRVPRHVAHTRKHPSFSCDVDTCANVVSCVLEKRGCETLSWARLRGLRRFCTDHDLCPICAARGHIDLCATRTWYSIAGMAVVSTVMSITPVRDHKKLRSNRPNDMTCRAHASGHILITVARRAVACKRDEAADNACMHAYLVNAVCILVCTAYLWVVNHPVYSETGSQLWGQETPICAANRPRRMHHLPHNCNACSFKTHLRILAKLLSKPEAVTGTRSIAPVARVTRTSQVGCDVCSSTVGHFVGHPEWVASRVSCGHNDPMQSGVRVQHPWCGLVCAPLHDYEVNLAFSPCSSCV